MSFNPLFRKECAGLVRRDVLPSPKSQFEIVPAIEESLKVTARGAQPIESDMLKAAMGLVSAVTVNESTPVQKAVEAVNVIVKFPKFE